MFRKEIVWGVNGLWCAIVIVAAVVKFLEITMMVQMFKDWGLRSYMSSIGFIELAAVALYLFPPTLRVGFFLLCAFFGAAIATTLQHDGNVMPPFIMLLWLWAGAYLRGPQLFENVEVRRTEFDYLKQK